MPQGVNTVGVSMFLRIASRPGLRPLAIPHARLRDVSSIPWKRLKDRGFRGVVFDKDNTLTLPYAKQLYPPLKDSIEDARKVFGNQLAVLSNSVGSSDDRDFAQATQLEEVLNLRVVRHGTKKPHGIEAVRALFPGATDSELVFVGDRYFTDIVFGNLHGMLTVYVLPFTSKGDNFMVRLMRSSEAELIKVWAKHNTPPPHPLFSPELFADCAV